MKRDNWLPPENYNEDPIAFVTHRTSPASIGLFLLATIAAHDLGYISIGGLTERLQLTLRTLLKLGRYRGHYFKTYDTRTLEPLSPLKISVSRLSYLAQVYVFIGDRDRAFTCLERAGEDHSLDVPALRSSPSLDDLRKDARYQKLLRKIRLETESP